MRTAGRASRVSLLSWHVVGLCCRHQGEVEGTSQPWHSASLQVDVSENVCIRNSPAFGGQERVGHALLWQEVQGRANGEACKRRFGGSWTGNRRKGEKMRPGSLYFLSYLFILKNTVLVQVESQTSQTKLWQQPNLVNLKQAMPV